MANLSMPQFSSCLPQDPFIKFGSGPGQTIDPNLPQTNEFSAYGVLPVQMGGGRFKPVTIPPPVDAFFTEIEGLVAENAGEAATKIETKLRTLFGQYIEVRHISKTVQRQVYDPAWLALGTYPQPPVYITKTETIDEPVNYLGNLPLAEVVNKVYTEGVKPSITKNYAQQAIVSFDSPPTEAVNATPNLFIIEEYRIAAYLGKYGMGRVVKTFTLLPGEKTSITVKTYKDKTTTQSRSENVLDSYSESSANDLENLVQEEQEKKTENKRTADFTGTLSFTGGAKFLTGVSATATVTTKNESSRNSMVKNLNRAIEKHVNNSNANRQIQVNTTTNETTKEGEESATIRELVNLNKSRVLNFVFRQLHQQYITVTYLADIKIAYTNGYEADTRLVRLEELRDLLTDVLTPESIDTVERNILKNYCIVRDYKDSEVTFIEQKTFQVGTCADKPLINLYASAAAIQVPTMDSLTTGSQTFPTRQMDGLEVTVLDQSILPEAVMPLLEYVSFWRKSKTLGTKTTSLYGLDINVPGVILSVKESTLKTSSVLAEAILGQADALDCFNLKIQDAESQKSYIENTERLSRLQAEETKAAQDRLRQQQEIERMKLDNSLMRLQMRIVNDIPDPIKRAEMYKKIFGTCCETPQTIIQH